MINNNIKKLMSTFMLLAFSFPSCFAITAYDSYARTSDMSRSTMSLNSESMLTNKNETITLSLRDSDVKQVLRMFADKANMNIVLHDSVKGKVTLDLVKTPINDAFNLVLQIAGLNYYKQGNTMIVIAKDSPDNATYSKQEMLVFPVKYVNAGKIADFLNKNVFGMHKAGLSSVEAATVNSATNELIVFGMQGDVAIIEKVIEQFDREPFSKTFAVNHTTPAEMANMICNVLLPSRGANSGSSSKGGGSAVYSNSGSSVSDLFNGMTGGAASVGSSKGGSSSSGGSSDSLKLGEGVLACSVSSSSTSSSVAPFDMQNLSIAYYPQRGTISLFGGSEAQAKMIENFIKANDVKQPQAMLEVSIVELNESGSKEFSNNWAFSSNGWFFNFDGASTAGGRPGGWVSGSGAQDVVYYGWSDGASASVGPHVDKNTGELATWVETKAKALAPATTHISWTMNYLIKNGKGRVLANPKIMITNGQESVIDLTSDYVEKVTSEYMTSTSSGQGASGVAQRDYTIGDDLGIKVTLTPFISPEGYVTMNIKPEYSTISEKVMAPSQVAGQQDLAATLLSRRNLDLKNIRIKDGETLIIGGMIQESEQKTVNKIPVLGDLPVVGSAFRSTATSKAKNELVIMITPKIINDGEEFASSNL